MNRVIFWPKLNNDERLLLAIAAVDRSFLNVLFIIMFAAVGAAFLAQGARNLFWSISKEQARFRYLVSRGLNKTLTDNGLRGLLFGGFLRFVARDVPHSVAWQILGLLLAAFGSIGLIAGRFASIQTPNLEQLPSGPQIVKRVRVKRLAGVAILILAATWVWNGLPSVLT